MINILQNEKGLFLTAYQICQKLEQHFPAVWNKLTTTYPHSNTINVQMGAGTGVPYSPATFVACALAFYHDNHSVIGLKQELFSCKGLSFNGVLPGYTGNVVGIWSIKELE